MPSNDPIMSRNWFAFVPCPGCAPHSVSLQCTRLRDPRRSFVHVNRGKHPLRFALRQTNTKSTSRNECGNSHSGNREANDFYERFEAQSEATFSNAKPTERFKLSSFMEWSNDESDEDYVPQVQVFNECAESETDNVPKPASGSEPVEEAIDAVSMIDPPSKPRKVLRQNHMPLVAIIGRPNVGKSMLVNRISGAFRTGAVVEDTPGVTRDRTYRVASWNRWQFRIVDTGGLVFDDRPGDVFLPQIRQQALIALREATVAVLVVDGQEGFTALDQEIASFLRKTCDEKGAFGRRIPILVAVNKCESHVQGEALAAEFWQLGLGQPMPVSGIHGSGVAELLDEICYYLPAPSEDSEKAVSLESNVRNVAIIGRPNVGKSSLLNALLGEERAIVSQVPGTTRDAIDELLVLRDERTGDEVGYMLIDTAGVRRKKNVEFGTEFFMINRAFKAIRRADVVLLVLDMEQGIMDQDAELAERIVDEGKACVLVGNKWDALGKKDNRIYNDLQRHVRDRLPMVDWANAIFVSAKTGQRIERILELVDAAAKEHARRVSTAVLNEVLLEAVQWQAPPTSRGGQSGKLYYCTQVAVKPPTIAFFVNNPQLFPDTYKRYLERKFREALGFRGTPIRMLWRERKRRARSALKGRSVS